MTEPQLVLVGAGKMGRAMLDGWLSGGVHPSRIRVLDPGVAQQDLPEGVRLIEHLPADESPVDVVVAVKPWQVGAVVATLPRQTVRACISVAAGVSLEAMQSVWRESGEGTPPLFLRVMPNLPVAFGEGLLGWMASGSDALDQVVAAWLDPLGQAVRLQQEKEFHAFTALAGSAPAFVAVFAEALADAGVREGLPRARARALAAGMLRGTAGLLQRAVERSPAELKDAVSSPGGTTIAGVLALEEHGFRSALAHAVAATTARSRAMEAE